jgi:peroxin-7
MDMTAKIWDLSMGGLTGSLAHEGVVNQVIWHPTHQSILGSCCSDKQVRVWDLRQMKAVKNIAAHSHDVLSIDFNKYENFIATSSTDNLIKLFVSIVLIQKDLRSTTDQPIMILAGHQLAVRKIKFSPYHANILVSTSYDMSVGVWDCNT